MSVTEIPPESSSKEQEELESGHLPPESSAQEQKAVESAHVPPELAAQARKAVTNAHVPTELLTQEQKAAENICPSLKALGIFDVRRENLGNARASLKDLEVRNVWRENLEDEIELIGKIVDEYPVVALDTEFPGTVFASVFNYRNIDSEINYQTMKCNVDQLKLIQLGLAFMDEKGNLPVCPRTRKHVVWQINFQEFHPQDDPAARESVELLRRSGIDFQKNRSKGVDVLRFVELLMSSGVVLNDELTWVCFHGCYDFAYFVKILRDEPLPESRTKFLELVRTFFPNFYDVKHLMRHRNLFGGLQKLADMLYIPRYGSSHQAGSDSLLTNCVFKRLKESFFCNNVEDYKGTLYGLENPRLFRPGSPLYYHQLR
eukprot:TRINITY_DN14374_c0_g1_i1.p1 TRINITY_DN14374_c0_g1~~TRINITY_DN14374_c0_g1_i1.p1  ORF type:complete len:374 (-),score=11.76 TRINITY_DN14374_c0_g1_i1:95-1216(-)